MLMIEDLPNLDGDSYIDYELDFDDIIDRSIVIHDPHGDAARWDCATIILVVGKLNMKFFLVSSEEWGRFEVLHIFSFSWQKKY